MKLNYLKVIIAIICMAFLLSCNKQTKFNDEVLITELNLGDKVLKNIEGTLIKFDEFVVPSGMCLKDSILFIKDSRAEKFVHTIDIKNNKYLTSFGIKGKGPGELLSLSSIDFYNNQLWAHDITLGKIVSFNKDSILNNNDYRYSEEIKFKNRARQNFKLVWINDSILTSMTLSESVNRLVFTNSNGEVAYEDMEMIIEPEKKDTPTSIHNQSYQGTLKKHPNLNKIAIVNRYSDLFEIYDLDNNESKLIKTHQNFAPIYEVENVNGNVRMAQDETTRFGAIDISVTSDKIFTLYSGRKRGDGLANYANTIYVYDWAGKYLDSYKISNPAIAILAENNSSILVMEYKDGIPMLKRYSLNEE